MPLNYLPLGNKYFIGSYSTIFPTTATYTDASSSIILNLSGPFTSYNLTRTNITAGNTTTAFNGQTTKTYTDTGLTANNNYSYQIVPINSSATGNAVNLGSICTYGYATITSITTTTSTVVFNWSGVYNTITITRSGGTPTLGTLTNYPNGNNQTVVTGSATDTNVTDSTTYNYTITLTNSTGLTSYAWYNGAVSSANSISVSTTLINWLILAGVGTTGSTNNIAYTTNGINYTLYTAGGAVGALGTCGITGFNGNFITSSSGLYSTNGGTTWSTSAALGGNQNNGACYFNGKFFAGGYNATGIYYSTNPSVSWTLLSVPTLNSLGGMFACTLNGTPIAFAFQGNIASGQYLIYYSTDGTTWTGTSLYGTNFTGGGWNWVGYNNQFGSSGSMVICTGGTSAAYSTNGSTWTNCTFSPALITGNYIRGVAYGNGLWMLINGVASTIYTSTNGTAFNTTITSPLTSAKTVSYVNGTWVIAGGVNSNTNNAYYSTNNGTTWTALSLSIGEITGSSNAKYL